ncbi:MAG: dihydrodipicolinate synthase family protein [Verrucomicrobiota bacterium]|nr:dihydrodipicolinate synthase family protein [Verrucomicrobiota bacterium]
MTTNSISQQILPGRKIEGISAVLLPFESDGRIDFDSFAQNVKRTLNAGIAPAVNMDTGYTNFLTSKERSEILTITRETVGGKSFVAGAFVEGLEGDALKNYQQAVAEIQEAGGTPILFQCSAFKKMERAELVDCYRTIAADCEKLLAFELGEMFAPFGQVYSLDTVRDLMQIPQLVGMKHSSLNRQLEFQRLKLRNEIRPEFKIYTGNDLAIDMVMYGSDYLLGLSAFCPEAFALRDKFWEKSDVRFYELNDLLQYLGFFAFRAPVPAYKHTAAQFLKLRGRIKTDLPHPKAQRRPESDVEILKNISERLDRWFGNWID